jgi:hypothetical protein
MNRQEAKDDKGEREKTFQSLFFRISWRPWRLGGSNRLQIGDVVRNAAYLA